MIRFVADEDLNGRICRGLFRRKADLDLVRVQDVGLSGASDEKLLEWAEDNGRIVLSHDRRTMPRHAANRLATGLTFPGLLIVDDLAAIGTCIEDLLLIAECSEMDEWQNRVFYVPFQ